LAFEVVPFAIAIKSGYLNAYFGAMSGFTTAGITVYSGAAARQLFLIMMVIGGAQ